VKGAADNDSAAYGRFCKELAELDDAIVAAFVLTKGGGIAGSYLKINVPALKQEDADRLAQQTDVIMGITRTNERLFGDVDFVLVRHESIDGIFFPAGGASTVLVGLVRPYDLEKMAARIKGEIKKGSDAWKKSTVDSI
jgi:hypothetical protein